MRTPRLKKNREKLAAILSLQEFLKRQKKLVMSALAEDIAKKPLLYSKGIKTSRGLLVVRPYGCLTKIERNK